MRIAGVRYALPVMSKSGVRLFNPYTRLTVER